MAEEEVDDLLEEAFKNIDEAEKNGKTMSEVIMKKAKESGVKVYVFSSITVVRLIILDQMPNVNVAEVVVEAGTGSASEAGVVRKGQGSCF
uniref:Dynein light chain n=1 Tax=Meloidogyne hapla TaxID=6305 RepID=A0A1I8BWS7_MELHA